MEAETTAGRDARSTAIARRRLLVVINPMASSVSATARTVLLSALNSRFEVISAVTEAKGHASELTRDAVTGGVDAVITFGGDGTANEAANALVGTDVPLRCLPGGSANVFCGVCGTPRDLPSALDQLLSKADDWTIRSVDTGSVNGRRFLFNSGVGLDAAVLAGVDARPDLKRRWRQWWYATEAGRKMLSDYRLLPPRLRFQDGANIPGVAVVVQNGRPWTYFGTHPVTVSPDAALNTGSLSATIVDQPKPWDYPTLAWRAFSGRGAAGHPRATVRTNDCFTVERTDGKPVDVHVDGDHIGRFARAEYGVQADALRVLA